MRFPGRMLAYKDRPSPGVGSLVAARRPTCAPPFVVRTGSAPLFNPASARPVNPARTHLPAGQAGWGSF